MRNAHFDMLPLGAFEHCGNGRIKLYGPAKAVTSFVSDTISSVGNVLSDAGSFIDDTVRDVVPGGWGTVAAVVTMNPELVGLESVAAPLELTADTAMADLGYSSMAPELLTEVPALAAEAAPLELTADTAMSDLGYSGAAPDVITEVPQATGLDSLGAPVVDYSTPSVVDQYGNVVPDTNNGLVTQVFDDGSTIVTDSTTGQIVSGTDTTGAAFTPEGYVDSGLPLGGTPETNFGGSLANPADVQNLLNYNAQYADPGLSTTDALKTANQVKNLLAGTPAATAGGLTTGLTGGSNVSSYQDPKLDFTPHMTKGSQISLVGMPTFQETYTQTNPMAVAPSPQLENVQFAATGGLIQSFGDGGAPVSLDPRFTKGRKVSPSTFYGNLFPLTSPQIGMPTFKAYNEGGEVIDHQPQFYSEGGLGTLKNRYVKGPGDGTSDSVPAMLANGEFVIPADVVSKLGNGSNDAGANVLDKFLVSVREHAQNHNPNKLPPKSKGALAYLLEAKKKKA